VCRASRLAGVGRDGWGFLPDVAAAMGLSAARARAQAPSGSRRRLRALGLAVLGALVVSMVVSQAAQAYVYWTTGTDTSGTTSTDTIARSNLDGSGANQSFITGASSPAGVAVDAAHVYWANPGTNTIARANLDGSGVNQSFITGASGPAGVAVDAAHVYWANLGTKTIARAKLDGSGVNQSFITAGSFPNGVAVDAAHVYWANTGTNTITRANLDGSGASQSFITGANGLEGVAVDALSPPPPPPPPVGVVKAPRISIAGVASSRCRRANFRAHVSVSDALKLKRVDVFLDGRRIVHTHAKRIGARVLAHKAARRVTHAQDHRHRQRRQDHGARRPLHPLPAPATPPKQPPPRLTGG